MNVEIISPNDAPAAFVNGTGFLAFGLSIILRPDNVKARRL